MQKAELCFYAITRDKIKVWEAAELQILSLHKTESKKKIWKEPVKKVISGYLFFKKAVGSEVNWNFSLNAIWETLITEELN